MKQQLLYVVLVTVSCFWGVAQDNKMENASEIFEEFDYIAAIKEYEDLVKAGYNNVEIYQQLGDANFYNSNYPEAAKWYRGVYLSSKKKPSSEYLFRYALSLRSLERYKESDEMMMQLSKLLPKDSRVKKFKAHSNYLKEIERASDRVNVFKLPFNSAVSDFAPSFFKDKLVFSSARSMEKKNEKVHGWTQMPFLNLYTSYRGNNNRITVEAFSPELNSQAHESSTSFSENGHTIYFTRNNFREGDFVRDQEGVSRLKIFRSFYINGFWSVAEELPFCSDAYSVAHPSLNKEGTRLYFASDMPGTIGGSDIFYVDILKNGSFGKPVNAGPEINTEGRESFPHIAASGVLYFASDGHPGLGGLDIFAAKIVADKTSKVLNLGKPINSNMDDFGLIINEEEQNGYFTSNREGGKGSDDIYGFKENIPLDFNCGTAISGQVINRTTGERLANATIQLLGSNGNIIDQVVSGPEGNFAFNANCKEFSVKLLSNKEEYKEHTTTLDLEGKTTIKDILVALKPAPNAVPINTELGAFLKMQRLKFDKGKTYIRPDTAIQLNKLYIYLRDFPEVSIEIRQYTDSRGSASANLSLSKRRAKSIRDYLMAAGVDASRLTYKGLGENQLVNRCRDGVQCSEKQHQKNNRSEFLVTN